MKNTIRIIASVLLIAVIAASFAACGKKPAPAKDYDINTKYRVGERVELRLELVYEQYYDVTVDGKEAVMIGSDDSYVIYAFIMPEGNAFVEIKEVSVEIPTR